MIPEGPAGALPLFIIPGPSGAFPLFIIPGLGVSRLHGRAGELRELPLLKEIASCARKRGTFAYAT